FRFSPCFAMIRIPATTSFRIAAISFSALAWRCRMNSMVRSTSIKVPSALLHPVVRSFLGDDDVVDVALAQAGGRDPQETRVALQFANVVRAAVAHTGTQAPNQLIDEFRERTLGCHAAFNTFGHQLGAGFLRVAFRASL